MNERYSEVLIMCTFLNIWYSLATKNTHPDTNEDIC